MLLKNIVIGALMAIPALASANSLTETRERMAIEQQCYRLYCQPKVGQAGRYVSGIQYRIPDNQRRNS